jgi:hypothetical protein
MKAVKQITRVDIVLIDIGFVEGECDAGKMYLTYHVILPNTPQQ